MVRIAILTTGGNYLNCAGGVETCIEEKIKWGKENGYEFDVFNFVPKLLKRAKTKKETVSFDYTNFDMNSYEEVVSKINNEYEVLMFEKEATVQNGFEHEHLNCLYNNVYKNIKIPKILWQHNGLAKSIEKYPYVLGFANESDAIFCWSDNSEYINTIKECLPSKKDKIYKISLFIDLENYEENINKYDRENKIIYLGRCVSIKEPYRLLDMANLLKENNIKAEMHGIDTSMASLNYILNRENVIDNIRKSGRKDGYVNVYGSYEREDGFKIMQQSMFGCNFFNYRKKHADFYGDRMEYTMQEYIANGTIPVFDRHWAENCKDRKGKKYIDYDKFAIFSTPDNHEEVVKEMNEIMNNKELQKLYRKNGYELLKNNFDVNIIMPEIMQNVMNIKIDSGKYKNDYDLVFDITKSKTMAEKFVELVENGYCMHMYKGSLLQNKICSIPERTNKKLIVHYEE